MAFQQITNLVGCFFLKTKILPDSHYRYVIVCMKEEESLFSLHA